MKTFINKIAVFGFALMFFACESSEDELIEGWIEANEIDDTIGTGTLDITKYVAVGNSLTAGFADGALFEEGQEFSYPSIIGDQFEASGGGAFNNPDITTGPTGTGRISIDLATALAFLGGDPTVTLADALVTGDSTAGTASTVSVNNFGVPGARSIDVVTPGYGAFNPYFELFQSSATSSVVADAAAAGGSFFSLWIGSNDALGYAVDGGQNDVFNPLDPSTITDSPINPAAPMAPTFTDAIGGALDALSANGAEGVILTLPPVTTAPYFQVATTLGGGVNLIPLTDQDQVDQLNAAFNVPFPSPIDGVDPGYNSLLDVAVALDPTNDELAAEVARRKISWALGANPPLMTDESLSVLDISAAAGLPAGSIVIPQLRQASAANPIFGLGDLFPLPALFVLGVPDETTGAIPGVSAPLEDQYTLTEAEQIAVNVAVATYNGVIRAQASARDNVTLVDLDPLFADINGLTAIQAGGLGMSAAGIAAADGVVGREVNGINLIPISFETDQLYNSVFSTDFIHPNARGAALVANEVIAVINETYGSEIPTVNPLSYPGINAPF